MSKMQAIKRINEDILKLPGFLEKNLIPPENMEVYSVFDCQHHYTFYDAAREPLKELQLTVSFFENFVDMLLFPHPTILDKEINTLEAIRFINYVNSYSKPHNSNGRFYIDEEYSDVVFSSRITYDYIEKFPKKYLGDCIITPMNYFTDIGTLLFDVCTGIMTAESACNCLRSIWE